MLTDVCILSSIFDLSMSLLKWLGKSFFISYWYVCLDFSAIFVIWSKIEAGSGSSYLYYI